MKMLGHTIACGPGGRDCSCCYEAPGKARKAEKRSAKRRERREWKKAL